MRVSDPASIKTVSMVRTGSVTHQLANDNRVVILHFKNPGKDDRLIVDMPRVPAQAIPGDYMLFVVDRAGTPSIAKHVRLRLRDDDDDDRDD